MSKMQLLRKVDEWKAIESERDRFIEELCEDNDRLLAEVNRLKLEAERANFEAKDHFDRFKKSEDLINRLQQKHDDGAYVSVLVDGDCVLFKDEHIRRGVTGGTEAAGLLVNGVREFLSEHVTDAPARISIHVRIYANVKGLGQAYYNAGILFDPSDIWSFIRGFNMGHPMCDFIDAGDGKECSDDKLKETFRSNISNVHCKHILLACSADNGYARLLAPLKADKDVVQLVTLVEGPPFASELLHLTEAFPTHSFPTIFRSSKLTTRPRSPPYGSPPRYAAVAASGVPPQAVLIQDNKTPSPIGQPIARNSKGQRIDRHLEYSQHLAKLLQKRKLCNFFHLFGECRFENCTHHHGTRLSGEELNALAHVARLTPCRSGLACDSPQCILGHQCPFGDKCMGKRCRFPESMHGIDTMVVSQGIQTKSKASFPLT